MALASTVTIDITGYDNEDIDRQFVLRSGTAASSTPYDLTDAEFEADIRDQKDNLILHLSSDGGDGGIIKTAPAAGTFTIHIGQGALPIVPKQSLKYDLLMRVGGELRRLWGGAVKISAGVTQP